LRVDGVQPGGGQFGGAGGGVGVYGDPPVGAGRLVLGVHVVGGEPGDGAGDASGELPGGAPAGCFEDGGFDLAG
jgi:hypothetical protein